MSTDDFDRLQIPNGIRLSEDSMMEIEVAFDGESVTYRDEEGVLQDMSTLCYLDHVLLLFVEQLTDDEGNDTHPEGITPGHVICHLVQHLHSQYHQVETRKQMEAFGSMFAGNDNENPFTELGGSAVLVGPDGAQHIDLSDLPMNEDGIDVEAFLKKHLVSTDEVTSESEPKADDDDEGEIIVHGLPNDPRKL